MLLPVSDDPTVSFRIVFNAGSQDDPAGKEGLAALTAAIVAEGSTKKRSYEEVLSLLYPMAADVSEQVDKEMTVFSGRTHKDNLEAFYGAPQGNRHGAGVRRRGLRAREERLSVTT